MPQFFVLFLGFKLISAYKYFPYFGLYQDVVNLLKICFSSILLDLGTVVGLNKELSYPSHSTVVESTTFLFFFKKNGPFPASFSLFSSFLQTVNSK